jgi:hypothetical protein
MQARIYETFNIKDIAKHNGIDVSYSIFSVHVSTQFLELACSIYVERTRDII